MHARQVGCSSCRQLCPVLHQATPAVKLNVQHAFAQTACKAACWPLQPHPPTRRVLALQRVVHGLQAMQLLSTGSTLALHLGDLRQAV